MRLQIMVAAVLCLGAGSAMAQTISPQDAQSRIGQTVTVEGVVEDIAHPGISQLTLLDIGAKYPNQMLTAVIYAGNVGKFPGADALKGAMVDITGPVTEYQGKAQIVLVDPAQLRKH